MRFLLDADLSRSASETVRRRGHEAIDVRDVGLRDAKDWQIARYAQKEGLCLLTADQDFGDVRNYPPSQYAGIVVLSLPRNATSSYINKPPGQFSGAGTCCDAVAWQVSRCRARARPTA
jgi:hypothetical protein